MNINVLSDRLMEYNAWRRGADGPQPNPTEIGELIDSAAARLEVLEREHQEFFRRWHDERRKREALIVEVERCYLMLLTTPYAKDALSKAEDILREALASQKVCAHRTAQGE